MFSTFDFGAIWHALPYLLLDGLSFSLKLTLVAGAAGLVLGTLIALMRVSSNSVINAIGTAYANLFRAVPLVLGIFSFYVLMPYIGAWVFGAPRPVQVGATLSAYVTFTMFEAAYFSEIVRAGLQSVAPGQAAAARALGMGRSGVMCYVVLPQALRKMLPVLLTQLIVLFQDTSLVYVLSLSDMFGLASKFAQRDNRLVEMYVLVAVVYFVISFVASSGVRALQRKLNH
ncbi:putative glutamate/aspartate ABC transporter, permease protein GltK [Variovorax paradoxus B4]|uniref:Glutamate/aspartate import permease protein GltK n=1 Tax=Variovorax paradoxus B4 TaxID=1246301 RepID=T1XA39_VARPD|nr:amino acid ABC transporter permease [Variovorax paradoxus]AGU49351.1 putative glutamate/aspartate ABC transporter, permease protein GltK [Variovorax paradoxus B4]